MFLEHSGSQYKLFFMIKICFCGNMSCYKHSDCEINVRFHDVLKMYYHGITNMHNNRTVKAQGVLHLHVLLMNTLPINIFDSRINWHCPKDTLRYGVYVKVWLRSMSYKFEESITMKRNNALQETN